MIFIECVLANNKNKHKKIVKLNEILCFNSHLNAIAGLRWCGREIL